MRSEHRALSTATIAIQLVTLPSSALPAHKLSVEEVQGKKYPKEKQGMMTITIPLLLQQN